MKNSFIIIFSLLSLLISKPLLAESFTIEAKKISVDKKSQISVFEDEVLVKTNDGKTFKSDYAEYNRSSNLIILKKNVFAEDSKNNKIITEFAEYNGLTRLFISKGITRMVYMLVDFLACSSNSVRISGCSKLFNQFSSCSSLKTICLSL